MVALLRGQLAPRSYLSTPALVRRAAVQPNKGLTGSDAQYPFEVPVPDVAGMDKCSRLKGYVVRGVFEREPHRLTFAGSTGWTNVLYATRGALKMGQPVNAVRY